MIKGKKVWTLDPFRLKVFYPDYKLVYNEPILEGKYIYVGDDKEFLLRFPDSIHIHRNSEIDLTNCSRIVELLSYFKKLSEGQRRYMESIKDLEECWNKAIEIYYCGTVLSYEQEQSVYKLFLSLGKSNAEIYREYEKIKLPFQVVLSSLLTMILKAQSYNQYQGVVSNSYIKALYTNSRILKNVKLKFVRFWENPSEINFIYTLMMLKV